MHKNLKNDKKDLWFSLNFSASNNQVSVESTTSTLLISGCDGNFFKSGFILQELLSVHFIFIFTFFFIHLLF